MDGIWTNRVLLGAAVSVVIWTATQIISFSQAWRSNILGRRNLVRSLYSEIDFNTKDLFLFLEKSIPMNVLQAEFVRNPDLVPHLTDARHTLIYRNNIKNLHHIDDRLIAQIVHFYGLLDKIKEQIDGLNRHSFLTISATGRTKTFERLFANVQECEDAGIQALGAFQQQYPKLSLNRHFRPNHPHVGATGY